MVVKVLRAVAFDVPLLARVTRDKGAVPAVYVIDARVVDQSLVQIGPVTSQSRPSSGVSGA